MIHGNILAAKNRLPLIRKADIKTLTIVNGGTESVPVSYDITHNHENGFIGIAQKYGAIQLGKTEEADGEDYKASEILSEGYSLFQNDHGTDLIRNWRVRPEGIGGA